jgi:multicomponent Na+:H+ antiporter subunit F
MNLDFDWTDPLPVALGLATALLLAGLLLCLYRVWRGRRTADRVVALDIIAYLVIGACALRTLQTREDALLRPAMLLALLAFLGTVAFARYLERRALR